VDVRAPAGEARWHAAGRPLLPALELDGVATSVMHPSQLASLLGLPVPPAQESTRLAWDLAAVLAGWLEYLPELSWAELTAPTPSRGRTLRNLTVNTFHPIELLPAAFSSGEFPWSTARDEEREAELRSAVEVVAYAEERRASWDRFALEADLAARDPVVRTLRGDVPYSTLLSAQRWHASFHHRQLVAVAGARPGRFRVEVLADLDLPEEVF
jgi:hypothetical protein